MHRWQTRGLAILLTASLIAGTLWGLSFRVSTKSEKGLVSISMGQSVALSSPSFTARTVASASYAPSTYSRSISLRNGDKAYIVENDGKGARIVFGRWNDQAVLTIRVPFTPTSVSTVNAQNVTTWSYGDLTARVYRDDATKYEYSAIEYEVVLASRQSFTSTHFPYEATNLVFMYQPPLTQLYTNGFSPYFGENIVVTETEVRSVATNEVLVSRPVDVVGSYAVYHTTERDNEFQTGKAFHIYRPKLIDALGNILWANLEITSTEFIISWDRTWARNAVYPVTIDPTFGYGSNGASYQAFENIVIAETDTVGATAGTGNYIKAYMNSTTAAHNAKANVYNTSEALIANGATAEVSVATTGVAWYQMNFSSPPSLAASTSYRLAVHGSSTSGVINMYMDSGQAGWTLRYQSYTYTSGFPNPATWSTSANTRASIYCDYTETSAPSITVSPTTYDFGSVAVSSTPYTSTSNFTIDNTSTMQTDQTISVTTSNWTGGIPWIHSDAAEAGADTAGLLSNKGGSWGTGDVIVKYSSPNYIAENQTASTDYSFGLKLISPTSFSDGVEKTIVVRVTAAAG